MVSPISDLAVAQGAFDFVSFGKRFVTGVGSDRVSSIMVAAVMGCSLGSGSRGVDVAAALLRVDGDRITSEYIPFPERQGCNPFQVAYMPTVPAREGCSP